VSRSLLALNALAGLVAFLFALGIVRELLTPLRVPSVSPPRPAPSPVAPPPAPAPSVAGPGHEVIATKNLFNPTRNEGATGAPATAGPKPLLHGVVMDGSRTRAYLEDPVAKHTFGYTVGDSVAGGRVQSIAADRVIIARPDGPLEVLLQDPAKPRPAAGAPAPVPGTAAGPATPAPSAPAPATPAVRRSQLPPAQGGRQ
jgi:hypothetical protein